jgi:hypothetical protein
MKPQKLFRSFLQILIVIGIVAFGNLAYSASIDFDTLAKGDIISTQLSPVTIF